MRAPALAANNNAACRAAPKRAAAQQGAASLWLAQNPSKRWTEVFFLAYSPFWILWALCILVPFQLYEVRRARAAGARLGAPAVHAT